MKITEATVKGAKTPQQGRRHHWDDDLTGFGLRVYPTGAKSFVYRYTSPETGRRRMVILGDWGTYTVAKARKKAETYRGRVLDREDPEPERKTPDSPTLKDFRKTYVDRMEKRWAAKTKYEYDRRIKKHLVPSLGKLRLDEITRADIANLLEQIAEDSGKVEANRVHELIRAMLNRAQAWGFFPEDRPNPARLIERFKERSRERWLKPEELERLMGKVRDQEDQYFRAFIPLLLLTGMRKGELISAKWSAIDLDRGEIVLPKTKSGKPQIRKLSPPAVEILRFLPTEEENDHVFPATGTKSAEGSHRADFKKEWNDARAAAGLEKITMHDLRRTAGSYMAQAGVPLQVIGQVLGHQHPSITKVYARLSKENEREALEALGEKLSELIGPVGSVS